VSTLSREESRRRYRPIPAPLKQQCLRDSLAAVIGQHPWRVRPRLNTEDADTYIDSIGVEFDVRFEHKQPYELPESKYSRWVAFIPTHDPETTHAVAMRGYSPIQPCPFPSGPGEWICGVVPRSPPKPPVRTAGLTDEQLRAKGVPDEFIPAYRSRRRVWTGPLIEIAVNVKPITT